MRHHPATHRYAQQTAPDRTLEQRLDGLKSANRVRTGRRLVKAELAADTGWHKLVSLFLDLHSPHPDVDAADLLTAKATVYLLAAPGIGPVKAGRLLRDVRVNPNRTLGGLSRRERIELVSRLGEDRRRRLRAQAMRARTRRYGDRLEQQREARAVDRLRRQEGAAA